MSVGQKMILFAIVLSGWLLGPAPARAGDVHEECKEEIREAEKELGKAIEKHGVDSRDAEFRRHQLDEIRDHCRKIEHKRLKKLEKEHHELHEELEEREHKY